MIIGITGGTGFIGKKLVLRHLEEGHVVRLLSRHPECKINLPKPVKYYRGDLTEKSSELINFVDGLDILYNCAGEIRDQGKMYAVHVTGTKNLCEAAFGKIGHCVQLSSVGVYGPHDAGTITEETSLNPVGTYEITKNESDKIVINASNEGAFSHSILRPSNVYGPGMSNQSLFQLTSMIEKGFFFFIGKPGASANYIHIDNVVEALILCGKMRDAKGQIYNLSDYRTMEEFVAIIAIALNKPLPELHLPIKLIRYISKICRKFPRFPLTESRINALTSRSIYSIKKIQRDLNYIHKMPMEDGVRQLVMSWKQFE